LRRHLGPRLPWRFGALGARLTLRFRAFRALLALRFGALGTRLRLALGALALATPVPATRLGLRRPALPATAVPVAASLAALGLCERRGGHDGRQHRCDGE
jgi:hypothetical protein